MALAVVGGLWYFLRSQPTTFAVKGIDVSRYQGNIDWKQVRAAGHEFAFVKATEGAALVDPKFRKNWKNARKHGLVRGAYHFYRPAVHSSEQAELFLQQVDLKPGDLPPVLDLEVTDGRPPAIIRKGVLNWMKIVEEKTGARPILYTMSSFARDNLGKPIGSYPLWIASLRKRAPRTPRGWGKWTFWQYSHTGRVRGITGPVDLNYFRGSRADLRALCLP